VAVSGEFVAIGGESSQERVTARGWSGTLARRDPHQRPRRSRLLARLRIGQVDKSAYMSRVGASNPTETER
jgi:hypothetical protein